MRNSLLHFWICLILIFKFNCNLITSRPLYDGSDTIPFKIFAKKAFKPISSATIQGDFKSYDGFFQPKIKDEDWYDMFSEKMGSKLDNDISHYFEWNTLYDFWPKIEDKVKPETSKNDKMHKDTAMGKFKRKNNLALLAIALPLIAYSSLGPLLLTEILATMAKKRPRGLLRRKRQVDSSPSKLEEFVEITQKDLKVEVVDMRDDVLATYLTCKGLTSTQNRCLERLACESTKYAKTASPEDEKAITAMLIDVMRNRRLKKTFKRRLSNAALLGRRDEGDCNIYQCSMDESS